MFNQQKYINKYLRENYKTYKFRVRNDDIKIMNKLNQTDNVNHYIYDLILQDIKNNRTYNFINNDIKINFEISNTMKKLIADAEEADLSDDYATYMNIAYAIDTTAKNETKRHIITEGQWNKLIERYCI